MASSKEFKNYCAVLVPYPVDKAYDYAIPEDMVLCAGDYVCVPLGNREVIGVVWGEAESDLQKGKIKTILEKYVLPAMPDIHRQFLNWVASYNMAALGSVLKMSLSAPGALEEPEKIVGYMLNTEASSHLHNTPHLSSSPLKKGGGKRRGDQWPLTLERSRYLRTNMTEAEKKLWYYLRKKQRGVRFRRQHPIPTYIVDFICLEEKLIIELDGGQHHEEADRERTAFLESQGYRILRFWNNEVLENIEGVLEVIFNEIKAEKNIKLTAKQQALVDFMKGQPYPLRAAEIAREAGCTAGVIKTLLKKGALVEKEIISPPPCMNPDPENKSVELSEDQEKAVALLKERSEEGREKKRHTATLLDGVTGAGKTEVYFEAVAEALEEGRQILILLPEIALSNAFIDRFEKRFGCKPALWHSSLTPAQRRKTWRGVVEGQSKVVVGARSALFLPYSDLGLIIVDEEHDSAFKQEDGVLYHARDMAVARGHMGNIPVLLVSATPSLETIQNAWDEKYEHIRLPSRFGPARLPQIHIVDMREDKPERQHFISPTLKDAIETTIAEGQQALLFLNRRGYAPLTLCRSCGHRIECPRCTAWLVEHKYGKRLECHHCGYEMPTPSTCPSCHEQDSLAACGPGVERILEEVESIFPKARTLILSSDTVENNDELNRVLKTIRDGDCDIIVGTQIIAKGHHFPKLTCVGVVDADLGMSGGDLRASERTYQLLHQVAGRAGREALQGHVYLQSFNPESRVIEALASGDRDKFLKIEAEERREADMPPYTRLAGIIVSGRDEAKTLNIAKALGRTAPQGEGVQTLGPAPAPMARLRGKYRFRLLVRAQKSIHIQKTIRHWVGSVKIPSTIRVQIDIDPQSFF